MELRLGRHRFDVDTKCLVVPRLGDLGDLPDLVSERPTAIVARGGLDSVEVPGASTVRDLVARFGGPVGVRTGDASVIQAALGAAATFVHDPTGLADPRTVPLIEEHGASVLIGAPSSVDDEASFLDERAAWCRPAGIDPDGAVLMARRATTIEHLSVDHLVGVEVGSGAEGWGSAAAAVMAGARLVLVDASPGAVRSIRRTVDTIGVLLARGNAATSASTVAPST